MAWSNVTLVVNTGGANANVSYTLNTSDYQDGVATIQNSMKSGGFWIQNTAAGIVYNQFIPSTAIVSVTLT